MATRTHSSGTRTHTRAPGTCANMTKHVPHLMCGALPQTHPLKGLKRAPRKATKVGFPPPRGRAWPFLLEPSLSTEDAESLDTAATHLRKVGAGAERAAQVARCT